MESAYCIAFYETTSLIIHSIDILNEYTNINTNTNTKLLFEIQGIKYNDAYIVANKMLKQIAEYAEIIEVTENYTITKPNNNNNKKKACVYITAFYNNKTKDITKVGVYNKSFIEAHSENNSVDNISIFTMYKIKSHSYHSALIIANQRLKEIVHCVKQKFDPPQELDNCILI